MKVSIWQIFIKFLLHVNLSARPWRENREHKRQGAFYHDTFIQMKYFYIAFSH